MTAKPKLEQPQKQTFAEPGLKDRLNLARDVVPETRTKVLVVLVRNNGRIVTAEGSRDPHGGVTLPNQALTYPTQPTDYGTIVESNGRGSTEHPALLVYEGHNKPIPIRSPEETRMKPREHPAVLHSYLMGRFMDGLSAQEHKANEALSQLTEFLKKIPWWGWLILGGVILGYLAFANIDWGNIARSLDPRSNVR